MSISGSNNPFACSPVVFANANSIISLGTITRDGNEFTFSVGFVWKINGVTYQNTVPVVLTIAEASEGFTRIDNALLNTSNTIELQQGLESASIALKPVAPDTNIVLTSWNISGTTIGDTEDPIIGTSFVKKSFFAPFVSTVTGADAIIPLDPNGYSEIRLTDASLTSIAGFDLSLITGVPTAEVPYNGKPYIIRNLTGNNITIKNELGAADFPFYLSGGADLVFPNGQAIYLLYDASGFNEIFKSWSTTTDVSGKQDKVFVVSASGTASNDQKYHVVSNATFTDPGSPVEGKGYEVFVRNGIATIGGVAYPVGSYVFRTYHSGAWASQLIGGTSKKTQIIQFAWVGGNYSANANWWRLNNPSTTSKYNFTFNQAISVSPTNAFAGDTNNPFHERLMFEGKIKEIYIEGLNNGAQWNCDFALRNFELTGYNPGISTNGVTNNQIVARKQFAVGTSLNVNRSFTLGTDIYDLTLPKFSVLRPYFKSEGVVNSNWQNVLVTILIEEV